ncbi:MAG: hypothetical protein JWP58_3802 [Hymenobacter sp.]|nr:hypothetical protein [Hymenobacter sp.]
MRLVDLTWLSRYQQTYHQVIADPWLSHEAVTQKPAFRALWVERFLRTFPQWHAQLKSRYPTFYLAIWLYKPTVEDFLDAGRR